MVRLLLLLSILLFSINISAMSTAIGHGPIGLMADHFHKKGEWMISLRVSNMEMKKNASYRMCVQYCMSHEPMSP